MPLDRKSIAKVNVLSKNLTSIIALILLSNFNGLHAQAVEFNTDFLDVNDRSNIDLGKFSQAGYIMPGVYSLRISLNGKSLSDNSIDIEFDEIETDTTQACLTKSLIESLGFKKKALTQLKWLDNKDCLDYASLPGIRVKTELSTSTLSLTIPQKNLEYRSDNWDPPSQWNEGVNGAIFDYNIDMKQSFNRQPQSRLTNISGYGVIGANLGAWRFRGDWQARYNYAKDLSQASSSTTIDRSFDFSRLYVYRALREQGAKLTLGETYLDSDIFDSFRFTGTSLMSDDNMLPPSLRGYAPEIVGVAKTNAKVVISQEGRVLFQTQVASGPFRIQDVSISVSGILDVRVEEEDGSVQQFQINTAEVPYLTRPGVFRYKLATGRPSNFDHTFNGDFFGSGEFSWGINNRLSLFGGGLVSQDYGLASLGAGLDLYQLGAVSFDVTESKAQFLNETQYGTAYRVNYAKNFEQYDSQLTLTGYRYSNQDYMNFSQFLVNKQVYQADQWQSLIRDLRGDTLKNQYNVILNKRFRDSELSVYLDYTHQSFWNQKKSNRYSFSITSSFDMGYWQKLSASFSVYRNEQQGADKADQGAFLTLSVPLGASDRMNYSGSIVSGQASHNISYAHKFDDANYYNLVAGTSNSGDMLSGYFTHDGDKAKLMANASHSFHKSTAAGLSLQGGLTVTGKGGAFHRVETPGSTRVIIDTDGVEDIPIRGYGLPTHSNIFGKAGIADIGSYRPSRSSIDVNLLDSDVDALGSTVLNSTLTEGAIGYRHFTILSGAKRIVTLLQQDDSPVPFGATVSNQKSQIIGMVSDEGIAYLSGLKSQDTLLVQWGDDRQCSFKVPDDLLNEDDILQVKVKC